MKNYIKKSLSALGVLSVGIITAENLFLAKLISESQKDYNEDLDYLFVLGDHIEGEETPGKSLVRRIVRAYEYLTEHPDTIAITCGGCFREGQKKSEAQIIKEFLMRMGISEDRILLEDKSTTTNENFLFGKEILENHASKPLSELNVGFLTSDYHLFRAGLIAKINGLPGLQKVGAKSTADNFIKGTLRELVVAPDLINNYMNKK